MAEKTVFGLDLIIDDLRGDRGSFRWNWEEVSLEYGLNNNCLLTRIIGIRKLLEWDCIGTYWFEMQKLLHRNFDFRETDWKRLYLRHFLHCNIFLWKKVGNRWSKTVPVWEIERLFLSIKLTRLGRCLNISLQTQFLDSTSRASCSIVIFTITKTRKISTITAARKVNEQMVPPRFFEKSILRIELFPRNETLK